MGVDINTYRCRVGQFVPHHGADDLSRQFVPHHGTDDTTRKFVPHHETDDPTRQFVPHHGAGDTTRKFVPYDGAGDLSRQFAPHDGVDDLSRQFAPHHGAGDTTRQFVPHDGVDDLSRQFVPHHGAGDTTRQFVPHHGAGDLSRQFAPHDGVDDLSRQFVPHDGVDDLSRQFVPHDGVDDLSRQFVPHDGVDDLSRQFVPHDGVDDLSRQFVPHHETDDTTRKFVPHHGAGDLSRQFVPHHGAGDTTRKFVPHDGVDDLSRQFVPHHGAGDTTRKFVPHDGTDDLSRQFVPHHGAGDTTRKFVPHDGTDDLSRQFAPHHGAGDKCISNFSLLTCMVGSLFFIGMILIMAGIESNPGPKDTFLFRYQYLLIEIGAKVLREIFELQVGRDFVNYLTTKHVASGKLNSLMTGKKPIITPDQEKLLPPMEKNPTSSAYDITLLSLLLRNICGLCPAGDPVWMNPLPTDHRVEADITRLKKCRNELMHIRTLHISEKDLKAIWQELEQILHRLNNTAGLANLPKMINDTKHMAIDDELQKRYLETIKAWVIMDSSLDQLKQSHSELDTRVVAMETAQQDTTRQHSELDTRVGAMETAQQDTTRQHSELDTRVEAVETAQQDTTRQHAVDISAIKRDHSELDTRVGAVETAQQDTTRQHAVDISAIKRDHSELDTRVVMLEKMQQPPGQNHSVDFKDIQNQLIGIYKRRCMTLPVSPVFTNKDDNLLTIYKYPTLYSVQRNRAESDKKKEITSYEGMFCKDGQLCEEIYLTGVAGVGKTAFCTCMSLLWCYVKSGTRVEGGYPSSQKDMEYVSKFDLLFYVSLSDTCHINVVDMIIEQLFRNNKDRYQSIIENILSEKSTLILMDGLDEWTPSQVASNKTYELPDRLYSNTCVYITTSRPHRLESVRLSSKDVDHHIEIIGISGESSKSYVEHVMKYLITENSDNETMDNLSICIDLFLSDMDECDLDDLLSIPIIASHVIVLWFEGTMTNMPRALIYAHILEMLFKRAEQRGVGFISSTESKFQHIPAFVSGMNNLNKHLSLLYNVCHLSFRSLFQSDEKAPNLVFTEDQLVDEPYCFTVTEIYFLCHIGILSKNEVFGCYSVEKLKLTFIHKSYLEFFAALYISSCDTSDLFDDRWKSIYYVLQSENMILLLVGMSNDGGKQLFDTLYQLLSDELSLCRTNAIFHHDHSERLSYRRQIESLQNLVINRCSSELDISRHPNIVLRLDDYSFDASSIFRLRGSYNDDVLIPLLVYNAPNVKSIHSSTGKYYGEFDKIMNLQCLHVGGDINTDLVYGVKFSELMIQNHSTLHTVGIEGTYIHSLLLPEIPVRSLHHLTSLSLRQVRMKHEHFHDLLTYISDNILMENIKLDNVCCDHKYSNDCRCTLNLSHHTKLVTLYLNRVNIVCRNINTSSIKSITSDMINIDLLHCIQHSKLEHLQIYGYRYSLSDYTSTVRTLTAVVKTLPCIRSLTLSHIEVPRDALLKLHPEVTTVKIKLDAVTMSRQCFHCFIQSCVNKKSVIQVELYMCKIISDDGEPLRVLLVKESLNYMYQHLTLIQTVNITRKDAYNLHYETRCQLTCTH